MEEDTEGLSLWQKVIKTVKAYDFKHNKLCMGGMNTIVHKKDKKQKSSQKQASNLKTTSTKNSSQIDKSTKKKLAKGDIRPEAKIDLHDMNQDQAYTALNNFIVSSINAKKRTLLVITGKGKNFDGVIRNKFMLWLEKDGIKEHILTIIPAAKKDGGDGAFYIRLRNTRKNTPA